MAPRKPKHRKKGAFLMAKYYLIRHAESLANVEGIYQGQTYNTGLSPRGEEQVSRLAEYFRGRNLDKIITSPLLRTMVTARAIQKMTRASIIIEPKIIETNHGDWEGKSKNFIKDNWKKIYEDWNTSPATVAFPSGETFLETQKRAVDWWKKMGTGDGECAIITHDNIIRIIIANVIGLDLNNIWKFTLLPTAVTILEKTHLGEKLVLLNGTKHLDAEMLDVSAHAL